MKKFRVAPRYLWGVVLAILIAVVSTVSLVSAQLSPTQEDLAPYQSLILLPTPPPAYDLGIEPKDGVCRTDGCFYYLAWWVWVDERDHEPFWAAPERGTVLGLVDLRSIPQMGSTPQDNLGEKGFGFFVYPTTVDICPTGCTHVGRMLSDSLDRKLTLTVESSLESDLGLASDDLDGLTAEGTLWKLVTELADPTGEIRWKPLVPGVDGKLKLYLGGHSLIREEVYDPVIHPLVLPLLRYDFKEVRTESEAVGSDYHRKVLGSILEKYAVVGFTPNDITDGIDPLPPTTTFTEDWNCADSGSPDCDLNWTEDPAVASIVSNKLQGQATDSKHKLIRNDQGDHSGVDHFSQAEVTWDVATSQYGGMAVRFKNASGGAREAYTGVADASTDQDEIYKRVLNVVSLIGNQAHTVGAETLTVNFEADGTTLDLDVGASNLSITDVSISGNTRTGLSRFSASGARSHTWDNFLAEDLAAVTRQQIIITTQSVWPPVVSWLIPRMLDFVRR